MAISDIGVLLGNTVFKDNANVHSVTIPSTIVSIGNEAFNGCINLTSVKFEGTFTDLTVGSYAFANCANLHTIELPAQTSAIGSHAFYVTPLTSFTIPAGVSVIESYTFAYTTLKHITIPANVSLVRDAAFAYASLNTITIEEGDGTNPLVLGDIVNFDINYNFESPDYSIYNGAPKFPAAYVDIEAVGVFRGTNLATIHLPARVTTIGAFAFYKHNPVDENQRVFSCV